MKRSPLRKVSKPKTLLKKAMKDLEKLQRLVILKRDGGCVLRDVVPCLNGCSDIRQADHLITKKKGSIWTRYELKNLNELCSSHNCARQYDTVMVDALIEITKQKHGPQVWPMLKDLKMKKDKMYLDTVEQKIKECKDYLEEM